MLSQNWAVKFEKASTENDFKLVKLTSKKNKAKNFIH